MKKKRIYCISIDAMISDDIPFMETLPNLGPIVKKAAKAKDVISVYPTLTYTCHA